MRESIGSTWVIQLVIVFILLFVGFLTLSLSYSKAFKVKNETMSIIEKYEGLTGDAVTIINNYLQYNNYTAKGKCTNDSSDIGWYGLDNFSVKTLESADINKEYYYCIKKKNAKKNYYYYEIKTFYDFNLPVVGNFVTFTLEGTTADIISNDSYTGYN